MKFSKKKDSKVDLNAPPRELNAIHAKYAEVAQAAGALQYQIAVYQDELENLNFELRDLNNEAAARNELNKKAE